VRFERRKQLIERLLEARTEFATDSLLDASVGCIDLWCHAGRHRARTRGE
jgi:hypothetical protein